MLILHGYKKHRKNWGYVAQNHKHCMSASIALNACFFFRRYALIQVRVRLANSLQQRFWKPPGTSDCRLSTRVEHICLQQCKSSKLPMRSRSTPGIGCGLVLLHVPYGTCTTCVRNGSLIRFLIVLGPLTSNSVPHCLPSTCQQTLWGSHQMCKFEACGVAHRNQTSKCH